MHMFDRCVCLLASLINHIGYTPVHRENPLLRDINALYFSVGREDFVDMLLGDVFCQLFNDDFAAWERGR